MMSDWFNSLRFWFSRKSSRLAVLLLLFCASTVAVSVISVRDRAQATQPLQQAEEQVIRKFALPEAPAQPPVYRPAPAPVYSPRYSAEPVYSAPSAPASSAPRPAASASAPASRSENSSAKKPAPAKPDPVEYVWEFNRSPETQNRLRLEGVYPEVRLGFTRARNWQVQSAKAIIEFRQSASLLPKKSNLTVRINDTAVGTVPLNRTNNQTGKVAFNIPANLIQNQNEIAILAEQQTDENCTNPNTPTLWTEILPTSKIVFSFLPQPVTLDFSRYPYPIADEFSPEPNQIAYLRPKTLQSEWLTAMTRYQADLGRLVGYHPLKTRVVDNISQLQPEERLVVMGTPATQPLLSTLKLPFALKEGRILDGEQKPLPEDVGVLMLTTLPEKKIPVLVAAGNGTAGVNKAVQFLVQTKDRQLGTGQALLVNNLEQPESPELRDWAGYLPNPDRFSLGDVSIDRGEYFVDTTVRGTGAPAVEVPFQTLPGDRVLRGSTVKLDYSYSPQVNPRNSTVEVALDDITLGAEPLRSRNGGRHSFTVNLPEDVVRPDSKLYVRFMLHPQDNQVCGLEADRQLWGTVHSDTGVHLVRDTVIRLPDLNLVKAGFPLAAPQDLSTTGIVLPDQPSDAEMNVLLSLSKRLGRITESDSIQLQTYLAKDVTPEVKAEKSLVAIGLSDRLPIPEALASRGLNLNTAFLRESGATQVQPLPDSEGVVKSVVSPWNDRNVLLALTAQREQGLRDVQDLFEIDRLFGQLQGDTALIHRNQPNPSPYDPDGYSLEFLNRAPREKVVMEAGLMRRTMFFLQDNWLLVPLGIVLLPLLMYGFSQIFLNRVADRGAQS